MNKSEIIVEIGAEGGSITLYGLRTEDGWLFAEETIDWTPELFDEERSKTESVLADSWAAALRLLDQYLWAELSPMFVHRQFGPKVWIAVQERLRRKDEVSGSKLSQWRALCRQ
jgi:hypothetical protein